MEFSLQTLGISAAGPHRDRWPSGHFLTVAGHGFLLDCGEGIQIALQRQGVGWSSIHTILISHLHGDHCYGLPGLLTSWALNQRQAPLRILSPPGLQALIETTLQYSHTGLPYAINWQVVEPDAAPALLIQEEAFTVHSIPLDHRVPCSGYLIQERQRPRTMRKEAISTYQIPFQDIPGIKAGQDFVTSSGEIMPNHLLTDDPPRSRSFAYCCDTAFRPQLAEQIRGVDVLLHEATFLHELLEQAKISGHSTALQAAELAKLAQVDQLILCHFSPRYQDLMPLLEEARSVFEQTELAAEGRVFVVSFEKRVGQ